MANDIFTQTYDHVFEALTEDYALLQEIPARNFISLTAGDIDPFSKGSIDPTDFPALHMLPTGGEINLKATSTSATIQQTYAIEIATQDMRLSDSDEDQTLWFPLKWMVLKALYPLVGGHSFTADVDGIDFTLQGLQIESNDEGYESIGRGKAGWFSVIDVAAVLTIPRSVLEG